MPDRSPESIPLIAVGSSRARGAGAITDRPQTETGCDDDGDSDDDGPAPPALLLSEKVVVSMPSVFAPVQRGLSYWRAMISRPGNVLVVVLSAIIAHRVLVEMVKRNISGGHPILGPITITTLMVLATMWLHFHQLDYGYQEPDMMKSWSLTVWRTMFAVCLLAPILVLPIFDSTYVKRGPISLGSRTYATLSSWIPVIPNMSGSIPAWMDAEVKLPWNPWAITEEEAQDRMPDAISFPLPNDGKGRREKLWNNKTTERHGVYMPVLATEESDSHPAQVLVFDRRMHATTQMLAVKLVCQFADISEPSLEDTGSQSSSSALSVHLRDDDSCHARVQLGSHRLEHDHRASIRRETSGRLDWAGGMGEFIRYLNRLARTDSPVTMYTPAWSRLSVAKTAANATLCQSKLGMVGLSRAFHQDGTMPPLEVFEAATCQPQFQVANISLTFHGGPVAPFHGEENALHGGEYLGSLVPKKRRLSWEPLEESQSEQLREELLMDATELRAHSGRWLWPIINEGSGDFIHNRPRHVGSLLFAGRLVRESFVAKLATAAELTLREQLQGPGPDVQVRMGVVEARSRAVRQVFQDTIAFHVLTWLAFAVLLVITHIRFDGRFLFDEDYAAWPLISPAARAMLLRHTSMRPWLRALRNGISSGDDIYLRNGNYSRPRMHIGNWYVHEKVGISGWRLDNAERYRHQRLHQANLAKEKMTKENKENEEMPRLRIDLRDELAIGMLQALPFMTSISIVGYLTLQGAGVRLFFGRSDAFDVTLERWRRLGVANFEPEASFWSILLWHMLPTSFIFFCMIFWLPTLYRFLCHRQPWANMLHKPQPAHNSITLDYAVRLFPLFYAVRNKHWLIATLVISNLFIVLVPTIQSRVLRPARVREHHSEPVFIPGNDLKWTETQGSGVPHLSLFDAALLDLVKNPISTTSVFHWSWSKASIIPLNLTDQDLGGYPCVQYETLVLLAGLECQEVHVEAVAEPRVHVESTAQQARGLFVHLSSSDGALPTAKIPMPCSMAAAAGSDSPITPTAQHALCLRWWLHETNSQDPRDPPRWVLAVLNGTSAWPASRHELQFVQRPSALGLACRSTFRKEPAKVTLSLDSARRRTTSPFTYEPLGGSSRFDERVAATLDRGLNASIAALGGSGSNIVAPESLARSAHFSGDILSWLMYQQAMAFSPALLDPTSLQRGASQIYAAYVAALADQRHATSILMEPVANPATLALQRLRFESKVIVGWGAAKIQLVFVAFCVGVTYAAFRARHFYVLPLSPEPLLHSLILIDGGNIVPWLEEEFDDPENLNLQTIYKRIDRSGLRFMLEPRVTAGCNMLALNIVAGCEEEEETREQDRDNSDQEHEEAGLRRRGMGSWAPQDDA